MVILKDFPKKSVLLRLVYLEFPLKEEVVASLMYSYSSPKILQGVFIFRVVAQFCSF